MHCSKGCNETYASNLTHAVSALEALQFERDPKTPNIFRRDGVATTLEEVLDRGLEAVLSDHKRISGAN